MQRKIKLGLTTGVMVLAILGLSLGVFVSQYLHQTSKIDVTQFHGTWLDKPRDVSVFDLAGTAGPFNNDSLEGHWTMMFFGFTTCPSICPTTMVALSKTIQLLEKQGVTPLPNVVLVSLDPENDTVEKLHQYVTAFNPHFIGARGANEDVVKRLAKEMGVAYTKIASADDKQHYNIEHSGTIMLFNPQGKLSAFFTMPHDATLLAKDYRLALSFAKNMG